MLEESILAKRLSSGKKDRIDKQYYPDFSATTADSAKMVSDAKEYIKEVKSKCLLASQKDALKKLNGFINQ